MKTQKIKPTTVRAKITIPGIGEVKVGPGAVPPKKGESSLAKIIAGFKKAQRERYLPSVEHVFREQHHKAEYSS